MHSGMLKCEHDLSQRWPGLTKTYVWPGLAGVYIPAATGMDAKES